MEGGTIWKSSQACLCLSAAFIRACMLTPVPSLFQCASFAGRSLMAPQALQDAWRASMAPTVPLDGSYMTALKHISQEISCEAAGPGPSWPASNNLEQSSHISSRLPSNLLEQPLHSQPGQQAPLSYSFAEPVANRQLAVRGKSSPTC